MSPVSLNDKLKMVWEVISSSPLYAIALLVVLVLVYLFSTTTSSNKKQSKRTYFFIYLAVLVFLLIQYGSSLGSLLDYAINQVFIGYYFPNIVFYILMLVVATIITLISIFKRETAKVIKVLNSVIYGFLIYFLVLVLSLVNQLKLDVFEVVELYSDDKIRSILELSMFIFVIWILVLTIYHFIRKYQEKKQIVKQEEFINYNIIHDLDETVKIAPVKQVFIEPVQEVKQEEKKDPFTLEEYRLMLQILQEEKEKKQTTNPLSDLNRLYQSMGE